MLFPFSYCKQGVIVFGLGWVCFEFGNVNLFIIVSVVQVIFFQTWEVIDVNLYIFLDEPNLYL